MNARKSLGSRIADEVANVCPASFDHAQRVATREPMQSVAVRRSYQVTCTRPFRSTPTAGIALSNPGGSSFTRTLGDHVRPPSLDDTNTTSRWSCDADVGAIVPSRYSQTW